MTRFAALLVAFVDALPFAVGLAAVTYLGGSASLGTTRAATMAAVVGLVLLLLLGLVSYNKYRGAKKRFWLVRKTVETAWMAGW
ncbi:hypothetical protein [Haloarchaeobius sp. HME9146]|uniref:hypothetical protein n=1 Tax=Haloarchaeobius sp. HME9146 TaxID=2978732 RepID=UPI0021BE0479|nr:hypothetical protein [Haloarchaeobius sp. HME9146]MCT9096142.1 hypothetical protein [Haloarchaeobius sp. HME9146]